MLLKSSASSRHSFPARAEDQSPDFGAAETVKLNFFKEILYPLFRDQRVEVGGIKFLAGLGVAKVGDAEVMERAEKVIFESLLQADFADIIVVKGSVDIKIIRTFRGGTHPEEH